MEFRTTRRTPRRTPLWSSLVFVLLAFSVFSWGLGYKLSLYHASPSSVHSAPTAKLISGDEQNTSDHAILGFDVRGLPPVGGHLAVLFLLPFAALCLTGLTARLGQWELDTAETSPVRRRAALYRFFFHPPPSLHA